MRASFPILPATLLVLLVTTAASNAAEQAADHPAALTVQAEALGRPGRPTNGPLLLEKSASAAAEHSTVRAGIRQRVHLFGQWLVASGSYLQGPPPQRPLRLEMRLRLDGQQGSLQSVYDGKRLWTYRQLGEESKLQRVDFERVRATASGSATTPELLEGLAAGGVPALLETLAERFRFDRARPTTIGEKPCWTIHGQWRPEKLAELLNRGGKAPVVDSETFNPDSLPPRLPDHVVVTLDRKHLFPYRIEFRRHRANWIDKLIATPPRVDVLATIEWFDVRFNEPIAPRAFTYDPGDHNVIDATAEYLDRHGDGS